MKEFPLIQTGCHTIVLNVPYSTEWHLPSVRRQPDGRLYTKGEMYAAELVTVKYRNYKKSYWRLTIHARHPTKLLSAKTLVRRVKSVLASLNTPAYIVYNVLSGSIPLCRVDLAQDYLADGVLQPTAEDEKEYRIKRMTNRNTYMDTDTLYIQTEKRTVVECRYNKTRELYEKYGIITKRPTSRIERRFHGARACTRHGVRTLPQVCHYITRMRQAQQRKNSCDRGEPCRMPNHIVIYTTPPPYPLPFRPHAARRTPEGGRLHFPMIKIRFFARGPPVHCPMLR